MKPIANLLSWGDRTPFRELILFVFAFAAFVGAAKDLKAAYLFVFPVAAFLILCDHADRFLPLPDRFRAYRRARRDWNKRHWLAGRREFFWVGIGILCSLPLAERSTVGIGTFAVVWILLGAFGYVALLREKEAIPRYIKAAEPGATDNPGDAQRLREDH